MRRKRIDDYCLKYLNDLFRIKLICLRSELNVASFRICMEAAFFGVSRFRRNREKKRSKALFYRIRPIPLSFFVNTPFNMTYL